MAFANAFDKNMRFSILFCGTHGPKGLDRELRGIPVYLKSPWGSPRLFPTPAGGEGEQSPPSAFAAVVVGV